LERFLLNIDFFKLKFYFRGVAHPHRVFCNPQGLNHGVLLVGYGVEKKGKIIFFIFLYFQRCTYIIL